MRKIVLLGGLFLRFFAAALPWPDGAVLGFMTESDPDALARMA